MALAWNPLSEPVEISLFSHYVLLCGSFSLFYFRFLFGDPFFSALFSQVYGGGDFTAGAQLLVLSCISPRCALWECKGGFSRACDFPHVVTQVYSVWVANIRVSMLTRYVTQLGLASAHIHPLLSPNIQTLRYFRHKQKHCRHGCMVGT